MKTQTQDVHITAANRFSPKTLIHMLTKDSTGTVFVDRQKIRQGDADDERLFIVIMNLDYRWAYNDYDDVSIYFEPFDGTIVGGIYNLVTGEKVTRRIIASSEEKAVGDNVPYTYTYTRDEIDRLVNIIKST